MRTKRIKIYSTYNSKPKTDLDEISNKNPLREKLIRLIYKFVKLVTKISSKMRKPKTYNEIINNLIYGNRWCEIVDEEL